MSVQVASRRVQANENDSAESEYKLRAFVPGRLQLPTISNPYPIDPVLWEGDFEPNELLASVVLTALDALPDTTVSGVKVTTGDEVVLKINDVITYNIGRFESPIKIQFTDSRPSINSQGFALKHIVRPPPPTPTR
jgi:hypothetical protein